MENKDLDFLSGNGRTGFEEISQDDLRDPYLTILQQLSPECQEGTDTYVEGAKPGVFFNKSSKKIYGNTSQFIVLRYIKTWRIFQPNNGPMVGIVAPNSIPVDMSNFKTWIALDEQYAKNEVVETYDFYCLIVDHENDGPVIFSLKSSSIKHAKNWITSMYNTRLDSGERAPIFSGVWQVDVVRDSKGQNSWFAIGKDKSTQVKFNRFITQKEYVEYVKNSLDVVNKIEPYRLQENNSPAQQPLLEDDTTEF